jgi:sugar phosphate isomerase/epimerase
MSYRLACADFTFPLLAHDKVLQLIGMLGLQGVDIGLFEERSHLWPSREFEDVEKSAGRLRAALERHGLLAADVFLQMAQDFSPYAINHPEAERRARARQWFAKTLDYAAAAGAGHVTTLPGVFFPEQSRDDCWKRALEELHWRVTRAKDHGIVFAVEAHVGSIAADPKSAAALVEQVPGLTLTLDYTHFTRLGISDAEVEPLVKCASHFHVRGARPGRLQAPLKDSTIDYRRVLEVMAETGYSGWLGIEYVWIDWEHCNECDNLSETILFRDFLRGGEIVPNTKETTKP